VEGCAAVVLRQFAPAILFDGCTSWNLDTLDLEMITTSYRSGQCLFASQNVSRPTWLNKQYTHFNFQNRKQHSQKKHPQPTWQQYFFTALTRNDRNSCPRKGERERDRERERERKRGDESHLKIGNLTLVQDMFFQFAFDSTLISRIV